ncbi:MAG: outer membrane beta-barrel family protein, partial [Tannerellaceae bacterium]|nr:outer membrane beta-barrel family protein [Tannerellaceae bacterium]
MFFESINEINDKLSFNISLQAEYFISKYNNNGIKKTLWNEWVLFPNATLTYSFSKRRIWQLAISSNKSYPSFWAVNPQTT